MGLINSFLKLFGKQSSQPQQPGQSSTKQSEDHKYRWQREQQARIEAIETKIKDWLIITVQEKGGLEFSWESGNDEGFIAFKDNDEVDDDNYSELREYLFEVLDIPCAGEFQMNGSGTIYIANNLVRAKYSSVLKELVDYNEETEEEIYNEGEQDSDDIELFVI